MSWLLLARAAFLALALAAEGGEAPPPYTDMNSVQALRNLERITEKGPKGLPEAELAEWVRARFARIALLRLEGKTGEALKVFTGCAKVCEKHGPSEEWKALKEWGCTRVKGAEPCR